MPGAVSDLGRMLVIFGSILVVLGVLLIVGGRVPWIGRLPGDVVYRRGNFAFYFPIVTSILLSLLLTLLFSLFRR
jgi:Protein of unknown function (DUF2905)